NSAANLGSASSRSIVAPILIGRNGSTAIEIEMISMAEPATMIGYAKTKGATLSTGETVCSMTTSLTTAALLTAIDLTIVAATGIKWRAGCAMIGVAETAMTCHSD